jgi:salicylate hydroxylase
MLRVKVIVGAGIGGLTTALALHKNGFDDVCVLEQAAEFAEVGAGVQISSNASRVLLHYGLGPGLEKYACKSEGNYYHDLISGEALYRCTAGQWGEEHYGAPLFHIHRADLHQILRESIPASWIRRASKVIGVSDQGGPSRVVLADGSQIRADLVIGADGLRSTVRDYVVEPATPRYSGFIGRRALIPFERVQHLGLGQGCYVWSGQAKLVVVYWCAAGRLLNLHAAVPAQDPRPESWNETDGTLELRNAFSGATDIVRKLIEAVEKPFVTGIFDRPVPERLHRNQAVLVGDAAHPVVPYLANGAAQAIEDAHVLARVLTRRRGESSVRGALTEYETRRRQRVDDVRRISAEVMKSQHVGNDADRQHRNDKLKEAGRSDPHGYEMRRWIWGYDVIAATEQDLDDTAAPIERLENSIWLSQGDAQHR